MIDLSSAYAGLKFAKDALQFTLEQKVDQKVQDKVGEALEKIGRVQDDLFLIREDLLKLQEENHTLKEEAREKESLEKKLTRYEMVKLTTGCIIYKFLETPPHYACPVCMAGKQIQILQPLTPAIIKCPKCSVNFDIEKRTSYTTEPNGGSWMTS